VSLRSVAKSPAKQEGTVPLWPTCLLSGLLFALLLVLAPSRY
jgi:hypothetical protein